MKKRGFTLIELLAVMVVIAVLALIAIPLVSRITERAEKGTFKQSASGILKTTHLNRINNGIDDYTKYIIDDSSIKLNSTTLKSDGKITGNGYVVYLETGESFINYTNGRWCATKDFDEQEVRVINGDCTDVDLFTCSKPEISKNIGNEIWTQYKIVSVGNNTNKNCKIKYSIDNEEYKEYKEPIKLTNEVTIKVKAVNIEHESIEENEQEETVDKIDITAPINVVAGGSSTSNSITATATGEDNESGIYGYLFSKDGGTTWVSGNEDNSPQTNNAYIFTGLTHDTNYNIKVKVYNNTYGSEGWEEEKGATESDVTPIKTTKIDVPTYSVPEGWTNTSKTVTIDYKDSGNLYIHEYSKDGGTTWLPYPTDGVIFEANGSIVARVRDGASNDPKTNIVSASSQTISGIDKTAPTVTLSANSDTAYSKTKSITVTLQDTGGSGIKAATNGIKYGWSTSNTTEPTTWTNENITTTTGTNTTTFTATGSGVTGAYYLWVRPVTYQDNAGNSNTTDVKSTGTFKFDNTAPTITLGSNGDTAYSKAKSVTVTLQDTGGSGIKAATSGIKYAWSTSNTVAPTSWYTTNVVATTGSNTTTFTAGGSGVTGAYYLWVKPENYQDTAGNKNVTAVVSTGTFKYDNTAPGVSYNLAAGTYSTTQNVTVTGSDTNYSSMVIHVYKDGSGPTVYNVSSPTKTKVISLNSEGTWTIYTKVYDTANNVSNSDSWYSQTYTISYPAYYAFGVPDATSTTDYKSLNKNVFIRLKDGEYSVCVYYPPDEVFECHTINEIRTNNGFINTKMNRKYAAYTNYNYTVNGFSGGNKIECSSSTSANGYLNCAAPTNNQYITSFATPYKYDYCGVNENKLPKVYCYETANYRDICTNITASPSSSEGEARGKEAAAAQCRSAIVNKTACPAQDGYYPEYCYNKCNSTSTRSSVCSTVGDNRASCTNNFDVCYSSCYSYYKSDECRYDSYH